MYICNRCGCTAMSQFGKKLVCLNCGNEQAKALSRKRESCAPNAAQHNASTVKHIDAAPSAVTRPAKPKKVQKLRPVPFERPKRKKPLATALGVVIGVVVLLNVVLPLIFGLISNLSFDSGADYVEPEYDFSEYEDYDWPDYLYVADAPWYGISEDGVLSFDEYIYLEEGNTEMNLILPSELNDYQVSAIGYDGFLFCEQIESVVIPDSVKKIETDAFWGCDNLKTIWLPDSITHIYYDSIYNCDSLEAVYYQGTQEQWDAIYVEEENEQLLDCLVILE